MSVDSDRQWFVYFKETEMGPFAESDLVKKIKAGDFDSTAFVYTDGMSDWELIKDTPLQKLIASSSTLSAAPEPAPSPATESIGEPVAGESTKIAKPARATIGLKPLVAIIFLVVVGAGYFFNRELINGYVTGANSEKIIDLTQSAKPSKASDGSPAADSSVNWAELDAFVKIQDPQGPAFRLSETSLAGMRPILLGALSPMLKMNRVTIAVFPDNEKSLYSIPPVWIWTVGVHSGYFSAGPHLNNGEDLLPGRYRVFVASQGKFLGDVGFDLGMYPIGDALTAKKAEIQKQLTDVSSRERVALKTRIQTLQALQQKLVVLEPLAFDRKGKRRAWLEQRSQVVKDVSDVRDQQLKVVSGPMFYGPEQSLLMNAVRSVDAYLEALEFYSFGGDEHVKLKLKVGVNELKTAAQTSLQKLDLATKDIDSRQAFEPLRLDAEVIKAQVLEESK